jgi:ADP-heptose:LPS heptosyltransferase
MADRLAARRDRLARLVRWPLPWLAPYRRPELHVERKFGMGDMLMATAALRELKRRNPACRVTLYTDYVELAEGAPFLDDVRPWEERPEGAFWINYERSLPPRRHIARIMGDQLGVAVRDIRPYCRARADLVERFRREWDDRPRPVVAISRRAGAWTPNKDWPDESWDTLVSRLAALGTVVDLGEAPVGPSAVPDGSYIDLRGRTPLPELVAAIAASDALVAPMTGTVHIAAAVGVPSVVIYGGYEHPDCSAYPGNINLYSPVECAPCWLRTPCPYGKKCLHQITPGQVDAAVDRLWAGISRPSPAADLCDAPTG